MNELQAELKNSLEKYRLDQIEPQAEHDDAEENFRKEVFPRSWRTWNLWYDYR